jgi:uncharacterized membrane protein
MSCLMKGLWRVTSLLTIGLFSCATIWADRFIASMVDSQIQSCKSATEFHFEFVLCMGSDIKCKLIRGNGK